MKNKKIAAAVLSATMILCGTAAPANGMSDLFFNKISASANVDPCEIYYTDQNYHYFKIDMQKKTAVWMGYFGYGEEITIPPTVKAVISGYTVEYPVVAFKPGAFSGTILENSHGNIDQIQKITLPGSIKTLQSYAFQRYAGYGQGWISLKEIVLEEGVESVEAYAFDCVGNIDSITFPSTITYLEPSALGNPSSATGKYLRHGVIIGYEGTIVEQWAKYLSVRLFLVMTLRLVQNPK